MTGVTSVILGVVRNFRKNFKIRVPEEGAGGGGSWPNTKWKTFDWHSKVSTYIVMRAAATTVRQHSASRRSIYTKNSSAQK